MTAKEPSTGWVCTDCIMFIANGQTPDDLGMSPEFTAAWLASLDTTEVSPGRGYADCEHTSDDHDEHTEQCETRDFAHGSCDHCRVTWAGTRHAVTYWIEG